MFYMNSLSYLDGNFMKLYSEKEVAYLVRTEAKKYYFSGSQKPQKYL